MKGGNFRMEWCCFWFYINSYKYRRLALKHNVLFLDCSTSQKKAMEPLLTLKKEHDHPNLQIFFRRHHIPLRKQIVQLVTIYFVIKNEQNPINLIGD